MVGMPTSLELMIALRRLQWLGHVAWMNDLCFPGSFCLDGNLTHVLPIASN